MIDGYFINKYTFASTRIFTQAGYLISDDVESQTNRSEMLLKLISYEKFYS
jgi:hypothetical protein